MPPKRYALYYHVWSPGSSDIWRLLIDEQIKRMTKSALQFNVDVYCCISGPQHVAIAEMISCYDWINILVSTADERRFEGETLTRLHSACVARPDLEAVGYIHTKGIRHFPGASPATFRAVNSWRHFLEWGTIDRWRDGIGNLQTVDVVGVNFRDKPWPHFSGNFWWASASYVRSLPAPDERMLNLERVLDVDDATLERTNYERWIGIGNPKTFSYYDFPFRIPARDWTFGFNLYQDDIFPFYAEYSI